jgi:hypothetical protein
MSATRPSASGEPSRPDDALRDEVAHLQEAVRSQRDIGMAIGLISATYGCSTEQAWRTLLRVSQDSNTKIRTLARVLVATHDGNDDVEHRTLLDTFVGHLPSSGWPTGPRPGEDRAP